jgi:putative DNA primase/helicase
VAQKLYNEHLSVAGLAHLAAWRGGWMAWQRTHWAEVDSAQLRHSIYATLGKAQYWQELKPIGEYRPWNPDKRKMANVLEALAAVVHLSSDIDAPAWINTPHSAAETPAISAQPGINLMETPAGQIISCTNGLFDLSTRTLHSHTAALFNLVSVPFDYDKDAGAEPTVWLEFLNSLWPEDPESIALLQEYMGYILSGRTDMQKMLLLIGPTRSGKGTIARILTDLVGRRNTEGPTLASMGTNFGLAPLIGSPLAIIADARLSSSAPPNTIVERLLSITGEDMLTVDRKFRDPWSGKLPTRFVILSNELPRFKDSSGAIANRMLILRMTNSFLGQEDHDLYDKLQPERAAILNWALDGLDRLTRNGKFTVPQSSSDAANLMMDLASPMSAFVPERCDLKPDATVHRDDLYHAWKTWCEDNGHQSGAKSTFGRDLRAVVPQLGSTQPRINGKQVWCYTHIGLLPVSPVSPTEPAGQDGAGDTGQRVSDQHHFGDADTDTGLPVSKNVLNLQVNGTDTSDTGQSAFKAQHQEHRKGFAPPIGPDRCPECGWHTPTQGHLRECSANQWSA